MLRAAIRLLLRCESSLVLSLMDAYLKPKVNAAFNPRIVYWLSAAVTAKRSVHHREETLSWR